MNRRTFIKAVGANAGTLAIGASAIAHAAEAPSLLPASQAAPSLGSAVTADVAVVGAGVFGGWTALHLREMGLSVVLIDQYGPGNSKASSGGEIRGMRATYGDQEHYSRWAMEAMKQWTMREAEFGTRLYYQSGGLQVSREWTRQLTATKATFDKLKIPYEVVQHDELQRRWPQLATDSAEYFGFYTPFGGVLKAHDACVAVARSFEKKGGSFMVAKAALGARAGGKLQTLTLSSGQTVSAGTFVMAAGPWLLSLFPEVMANKLMVAKRGYYMVGVPPGDKRFSPPDFPNTGVGVPNVDGLGLAVLMGSGNTPVDPDTHDRVPTPEDKAAIAQILATRFPSLKGQPILNAHICQSDSTVDGNFIVDRHPGLENVWLVGGGSYHGFKFGPVSGNYVANRVVGRDKSPELATFFRIKGETFAANSPVPPVPDLAV